MTFQMFAVKRATELSEEVNRLRPPRSLHSDGILRPFCLREAEGNKLLKYVKIVYKLIKRLSDKTAKKLLHSLQGNRKR